MTPRELLETPVIILCGGLGTRLREETEHRPKPLVEVGGRPILWHIMMSYSHYGFNRFILLLGYKGDMIKQYFADYDRLTNDYTLDLSSERVNIHRKASRPPWTITFLDTGLQSMTGWRLKQAQAQIQAENFFLTYGDGVADMDIRALLHFHGAHGKIGTVTGVFPPPRFGALETAGTRVTSFAEKPTGGEGLISGGFFVFQRAFLDRLEERPDLVLEKEPLEKLSDQDELRVWRHHGFWQCMDTPRDLQHLEHLWRTDPPWRVWPSFETTATDKARSERQVPEPRVAPRD